VCVANPRAVGEYIRRLPVDFPRFACSRLSRDNPMIGESAGEEERERRCSTRARNPHHRSSVGRRLLQAGTARRRGVD